MIDEKFSHLSSKYEDFMRKIPQMKDKCLEESITPLSWSFIEIFLLPSCRKIECKLLLRCIPIRFLSQ